MQNQEHSAYHEQDVNQAFGDLERKIYKRPKDNQNHGNCCQHFVISWLRPADRVACIAAGVRAEPRSNIAHPVWKARRNVSVQIGTHSLRAERVLGTPRPRTSRIPDDHPLPTISGSSLEGMSPISIFPAQCPVQTQGPSGRHHQGSAAAFVLPQTGREASREESLAHKRAKKKSRKDRGSRPDRDS